MFNKDSNVVKNVNSITRFVERVLANKQTGCGRTICGIKRKRKTTVIFESGPFENMNSTVIISSASRAKQS